MKYDLEERLIKFSLSIIAFVKALPNKQEFQVLGNQILRSGTAPALLYGEAQAAESRKDFIHKMRIGLKELRETSVSLKILGLLDSGQQDQISKIAQENNELIAIFVKSIKTASSK